MAGTAGRATADGLFCRGFRTHFSTSLTDDLEVLGGASLKHLVLPFLNSLSVDKLATHGNGTGSGTEEIAGGVEGTSPLACLSSLNADLVEASGKMMVETVRAKADGVVTPAEAQQLRALSRKIERIRADIDDQLAKAEARDGLRVIGGGAS